MKRLLKISFIMFLSILILTLPMISSGETIIKERKIIAFEDSASPLLKSSIIKQYGGDKLFELKSSNSIVAYIPKGLVKKLADNPNIKYVVDDIVISIAGKPSKTPKPDRTPRPTNDPNPSEDPTPDPGSQILPWGIARVNADDAWNTTQGQSVNVAVLDTGIDSDHPDIVGNFAGGKSFIAGLESYEDDNGHGTHVSGTIAAQNNTFGVVGVAPKVNIYALKVLGSNGSGNFSSVLAALEWCTENNIHIANMSLSANADENFLKEEFDYFAQKGLIMIAASGNDYGNVAHPALLDSVIAVSAINSRDKLARFSNTGPEIEYAAPGVSVDSTYPDDTYATGSGTSMAAPHVSGIAALVIDSGSADTDSDGITSLEELRLKLNATAIDLGRSGFDNLYGYGLPNAYQATR